MWYKVRFRPKSAISSDFSSDILWGHLLWIGRRLFSDEWLEEEIERGKKGEGIKVSSFLPYWDGEVFVPNLKVDFSIGNLEQAKTLKKLPYVPLSLLLSCRNNFRVTDFVEALAKEKNVKEIPVREEKRIRNTINRFTGTTLAQGGLYSQNALRVEADLIAFVDWPYEESKLVQVLTHLALIGYGSHKGVGYGHLTLEEVAPFSEEGKNLFSWEEGDLVVLLGLCLPDKEEFIWDESWYSVKSKIGKLGEEFAMWRPFYKRPLWFLEEGSLMKIPSSRTFFGKIESNVHPDPRIHHYGISFGIKLRSGGEG